MPQPLPEFAPVAGRPLTLEPGLRLVLAPNPSPMTERGTNTYLIGQGNVIVLDPGPRDDTHLRAILNALDPGEQICAILVSHAHMDHSPLARPLARETGAPVLAYGDAIAGRSARMRALSREDIGGGEGVDADFTPDRVLDNGETFTLGGETLQALHTPGHFGNHLCFAWRDAIFTADHVMAWAPSLVSPPDGDLTDFMTSLDLLETLGERRYYPGHGAPIADGLSRTRDLRAHRRGRERSILAAVEQGANTVADITSRVYTDVPPALLPAAERNVLAHLIDLDTRNCLRFIGRAGIKSPVEKLPRS